MKALFGPALILVGGGEVVPRGQGGGVGPQRGVLPAHGMVVLFPERRELGRTFWSVATGQRCRSVGFGRSPFWPMSLEVPGCSPLCGRVAVLSCCTGLDLWGPATTPSAPPAAPMLGTHDPPVEKRGLFVCPSVTHYVRSLLQPGCCLFRPVRLPVSHAEVGEHFPFPVAVGVVMFADDHQRRTVAVDSIRKLPQLPAGVAEVVERMLFAGPVTGLPGDRQGGPMAINGFFKPAHLAVRGP